MSNPSTYSSLLNKIRKKKLLNSIEKKLENSSTTNASKSQEQEKSQEYNDDWLTK